MATPFIGKSVAPFVGPVYAYQCNTAGMVEGAAMVHDSAAGGQLVKAPAGAGALGFAGLIRMVLGPAGTTVGMDLDLQRTHRGHGLLKAGQSVTVGDELVIAGADGSLRRFDVTADDDCDIIGTAEMTKTAGGTNEAILVNLDAARSVHKDNS